MKVLKTLTCSLAVGAFIVAPTLAFADAAGDSADQAFEPVVNIADIADEAVMSWAVRVPVAVEDSDAVYFAFYTLENSADIDGLLEYFRDGGPISYAQFADLVETNEAGLPQAYAWNGDEWVETTAPEGLHTVTFAYEAYPRSFEVAFPAKSWTRLVEVSFDGTILAGALENSREVDEEFTAAFEALGNPTTPEAAAEFLARFDAGLGQPVQIPAASEATGIHELSLEGMAIVIAYPEARPGVIDANADIPAPAPDSQTKQPADPAEAPSDAPSLAAAASEPPAQRTVALPVTNARPATERPAVAAGTASASRASAPARTQAEPAVQAEPEANSEAAKPALPITGSSSKAADVAEAVGLALPDALGGSADTAADAGATATTSLVNSSSSARAATVALFACAGIGVVGAASFASIRRVR